MAIPNEYGLLIGLFYTISVYGLSDIKVCLGFLSDSQVLECFYNSDLSFPHA